MDDKRHSISISTAALVLASAVLVAAKVWGGLPWAWWVVTLPLWIVVAVALLLLILMGFAILAVLALWFGGRR